MDSQQIIIPEWIKVVEKAYFLHFDENQYLEPLVQRLKLVRAPFISSGHAFQSNLEALIAVVSVPITLASATATQMRLQQLSMAERIRRISPERVANGEPSDLSPVEEKEAHEAAHEKLSGELATKDGLVQVGTQAWRFLHNGLQSSEMPAAAHELLRQGAVLCWGALEVLAREVFAAYVNASPRTAKVLIEHPSTRGRFDLKAIPVEVLDTHGFDISTHMGDVLLQRQDLADLGAIKDVYQVLFPTSPGLHSALGERDLWILNQRRHLIVHKRGIADARYLERTGERVEIGRVLNISPAELKEYLRLVRDAAIEILRATDG